MKHRLMGIVRMRYPKRRACSGLVVALLGLVGCARDADKFAKQWMAEMDAKPPEERVPNWDHIRAMMMREPPKVGDPAPDFALKTRDGTETIRLSQFRDDRPVVIIFGSWT